MPGAQPRRQSLGVPSRPRFCRQFTRRDRRTLQPLVYLNLFRMIPSAGGILGIVLSYAMLYGIFLLISLALVRGHQAPSLAAGLRLAMIVVVLGIVAPFSGALHERLGVRIVLLSGMKICIAAISHLSVVRLSRWTACRTLWSREPCSASGYVHRTQQRCDDECRPRDLSWGDIGVRASLRAPWTEGRRLNMGSLKIP